ncbi:hypothetical protein [Lachnoclostridium sp. An118]|uniref:hypothetical protein n=1 Tax=Lachnoclostridium sp. An118 TaxID=1965547 RepID=UPI000B3AF08F|nr:hypothetical protein [Lachnoclostridium sp. An118]OUQ49891.1 hypothetical protein B5E62_09455 [Lachnoclostridium sp. An118]
MKITVSSALKQVGTFFIKLCRDYCEKQKKARIEKEKQAERDATVKMLTLWLAYLNHDKALKLYRGLKPDIHTKKDQFFVLFNPGLEAKQAERDYASLCRGCWIDFLNMLNQKLAEYQEELRKIEQIYAEKCQQHQENFLLIEALQNDLQLEADRRVQTKYLQQVRELTAENRKLFREGQELCSQRAKIEDICSEIYQILTLAKKGRRPTDGYYNNQPDHKLFVLHVK